MNHASGTVDNVSVHVGIDASDCPGDAGRGAITTIVPASMPTTAAPHGFHLAAHPTRVFDVGPGQHRYFLTVQQFSGGGNDYVRGSLEATFHPN